MHSNKEKIDYYIRLTLAVWQVTHLFPENEPLKLEMRRLANDILAGFLLLQNNGSTGRSTLGVSDSMGSPQGGTGDGIFENIKTLKEHFNIAENKNLVDARNFLVLCQEYTKIEGELEQSGKRQFDAARQGRGSLAAAELVSSLLACPERSERACPEPVKEICPEVMGEMAAESNMTPVEKNPPVVSEPIDGFKNRHQKILSALNETGSIKTGDLIKILPEVNRRTILRDIEDLISSGLVKRSGSGRGASYATKNGSTSRSTLRDEPSGSDSKSSPQDVTNVT